MLCSIQNYKTPFTLLNKTKWPNCKGVLSCMLFFSDIIQNADMLLHSFNCIKIKLEWQAQDVIFQMHISFFWLKEDTKGQNSIEK